MQFSQPPPIKPDINEILKKYGSKIESQINTTRTTTSK